MEQELTVLFVRPVWRNYGISRRLIETWQALARKRGTTLSARLELFDAGQIALLERSGFLPQNPEDLAPEILVWAGGERRGNSPEWVAGSAR